jgi:hypothetical protein
MSILWKKATWTAKKNFYLHREFLPRSFILFVDSDFGVLAATACSL